MSTENEIEVNELDLFNSMLGASWDQIEDLPDFVTPAVGDYLVRVEKCEVGTSADKTQGAIKLIGKIEAVVELSNPSDVPPPEGSLVGGNFVGKVGVQRFKKSMADVAEALGAEGPAQLIEMLEGNLLAVTFRQRADKEKIDPNTGKPVVYPEWATIVLAS
jgi:hypothetical protein